MTTRRTTAERIVAAATKALERHGARNVTMRRVARAVGVSAMAIYRHFPSREALLHRVVDASFAQMSAHWAPGSPDSDFETRLIEVCNHYLDFALDHPHTFDYMYGSRRDDARRYPEDFRSRRSPTANLIVDLVEEAMSTGYFRRDDSWDVTLALWAHGHGLICLYRAGRFSYSAEEFRTFYHASLRRTLEGLKA
jgi:AcrR family transcriptional regulator